MNKRKLKIYFQTKTDFLDDFLPKGSLCMGQDCKKKSNSRFADVTTLKLTNFILLLLDQLHSNKHKNKSMTSSVRGAMAGKAPKAWAWALPRFWISMCSYKKKLGVEYWV